MTDAVDEPTPPPGSIDEPSRLSTLLRWLTRHWRSLLTGAIAGGVLGSGFVSSMSEGGLAMALGLSIVIPAVIILFVALLMIAGVTKQSGPAIAALAMAALVALGVAWGGKLASDRETLLRELTASGTGTVTSRASSSDSWSGPVTCGWQRGAAGGVEWVRDFHVPIADPAFTAERLPDGSASIDVTVEGEGVEYVDTSMGGSVRLPVDLQNISGDWRTGTATFVTEGPSGPSPYRNAAEAVFTEAGIVLGWSCDGGP